MKKNNAEIKKKPGNAWLSSYNWMFNRRKGCQCHYKQLHQLQLRGIACIQIKQRIYKGIYAVRYVCHAKVMVNRKRMVKVGRV